MQTRHIAIRTFKNAKAVQLNPQNLLGNDYAIRSLKEQYTSM